MRDHFFDRTRQLTYLARAVRVSSSKSFVSFVAEVRKKDSTKEVFELIARDHSGCNWFPIEDLSLWEKSVLKSKHGNGSEN